MLKKHMAACLVVTAFAALPAFAQSSPPPSAPTDRPTATGSGSTTSGSPAMLPGATGSPAMQSGAGSSSSTSSSSTGASPMSSASAGQGGAVPGQFMTQMQPNQIMASKLIGTRVVSTNNESIGDINDVVIDRNGQAVAAVVGVGGFLGIGEKDVAVPFNSLEFADNPQASVMGNNNAASGGNVATTGSTTSGRSSTASSGGGSSSGNPDRVVLRMTKAELQAAPTFNASGDASNRSSTGGQSGSTTAPKQ